MSLCCLGFYGVRFFHSTDAYLSLLPTLPENLPVVAVAGVLQAKESPVTEPGVGGVRFQNTETHYPIFTSPHHTKFSTFRGPGAAAFCLFGLHHRGNDVIQEVWEAALQLVALNVQRQPLS